MVEPPVFGDRRNLGHISAERRAALDWTLVLHGVSRAVMVAASAGIDTNV
jgi:hypothetical protein